MKLFSFFVVSKFYGPLTIMTIAISQQYYQGNITHTKRRNEIKTVTKVHKRVDDYMKEKSNPIVTS